MAKRKNKNYQNKNYKKRKKGNPILETFQGLIILFVIALVVEADFRQGVFTFVDAKLTGKEFAFKGDNENQDSTDEQTSNYVSPEAAMELNVSSLPSSYSGLSQLTVDACDLSSSRQANVVVDVGFGARTYLARTNEFGQVVEMYAEQISLQNENSEPTTDGRYCSDEANVPGTEDYNFDQGHIIADVLGGSANAYNITPQNSSVNREGGTWYNMEQDIRNALGSGQVVSNFHALITYPSTNTQVPSEYRAAYKVDGVSKTVTTDN